LTAQSADLDLALERDQRAQGFVNHLAFVSNAGHPAGALDEFIVNVNVNTHVVRPLYTCAGRVRPPAQGDGAGGRGLRPTAMGWPRCCGSATFHTG
jgi:hypothetical protein